MINLRNIGIFVLMALFSKGTYAIGLDDVILQEMSSSRKSIVINRGLLEDYKVGSYAKFFIQVGELEFPKIFLVAEGKLVKSFPNKSFWYLSNIYLPKFIDSNAHLLVLTSNAVSEGRKIVQKHRHVLVPEDSYNSVEEYLAKNQNAVPDKLLQDLDSYEESFDLYETKKVPDADQLVQTYEVLKKKQGKQFSDDYKDEISEVYFVGNKKVQLADLKNAEDKKLLDSISEGYIQKTNSQKYGLSNGLYKNQKKIPGYKDINQDITVTSVYDTAKEDEKSRDVIDNAVTAKLKREGPSWSEDMDDVTLRRYFIRSGLEHEVKRREIALNELDGNEVLFNYSGSMTDHSSANDQNYRNLGYTLGVGYDLHLSRTSKNLKNWSLQFILEKGVSDYNLGGQNGRGEEGIYGAYLNYYFINNPLTLNSFIYLAGVGLKAGTLAMSNQTLSKEYSYQLLTLPSFQLMTKYRFRTGDYTENTANIGASINAGVVLDMKRLSVIDTLADNIDGKISINDIKYLIGMSFYF